MTRIIAETKDTNPALGEYYAVIKLLSVLDLTNDDRAVLATNLLSDIAGDDAEPADAKSVSDLSLSATLAAVTAVPDTSSSITPAAVDPSPTVASTSVVTPAAVDPSPTVASTSVVTVVDEGDGYAEVHDAIAEGCILNAYKRTYFNIPVSNEAAHPLYYVTRGRKIGVFSGWGNVGPKVLGVSCAIFAKVETIEQGIEALVAAIDAGTAMRV